MSARPFPTPADAEAAFYRAIERADLGAIERVWSADERIACVHPGTERIEGRAGVIDSFRQMFAAAPTLGFDIVDTLATGDDELAVHVVRERIALDGELVSIMIATNVYRIEDGGWRMLLHHASPEPDTALDAPFDDVAAEDEPEAWPEPPPVLH